MLKIYLKRYFWMFSLGALVAGIYFPEYGKIFHGKESLLIMGILFFNLLGVSLKDFIGSVKMPFTMIFSLLVLSGVFTGIIFLNKEFFSEEVFTGLILASTSGISFSGLLIANIFNGDKARLFILMLSSFAVSAFIIPAIFPSVNTFDILLDTAYFLFLPVFFAGVFSLSSYGEHIEKHGSYYSILLFSVLIYSLSSSVSNLNGATFIIILAIIFNLINIFFGLALGKNKAEKISYATSSIMRNYEIALLITISAFKADTALVLMVFMLVSYFFLPPSLFILSKLKS